MNTNSELKLFILKIAIIDTDETPNDWATNYIYESTHAANWEDAVKDFEREMEDADYDSNIVIKVSEIYSANIVKMFDLSRLLSS